MGEVQNLVYRENRLERPDLTKRKHAFGGGADYDVRIFVDRIEKTRRSKRREELTELNQNALRTQLRGVPVGALGDHLDKPARGGTCGKTSQEG